MELRHIRYFVAVAEELHITRAAERLGIQQPPLSHQIKALETELDVQLFRRVPRGVELTDAGRTFLADAYEILQDVDRATAKALRTSRGMQGSIVVGFTSSCPFHPFVPKALREFRAEYPLVSLTLEESGTDEMVDAILAERMDVAFIRSDVGSRPGVSVHSLLDEPMLVAVPASHPKAVHRKKRSPVSLEEFRSDPFVLYRRRSAPGLYDTIIEGCRQAGFVPTIEQEAPRITSTLSLVSAGLGISVVPASLESLGMSGVEFLTLKRSANLKAPIRLACRSINQSQSVSNFAAFARRSAQTKSHRK